MRKYIVTILITLLLLTMLVGCSDITLMKGQLVSANVDKIHIVTAIGNPATV